MDDVVIGLLEAINKEFGKRLAESKKVRIAADKIKSTKASYQDVSDFAIAVGEALAKSFSETISSEVLPNGRMYYNIANRILGEMLGINHKLISEIAAFVQESLNARAGLGLKAIKPKINQDRIDGLINRLASEEIYDNVAWLLDEPVVNFSQSVVDDAIKTNADFHFRAGLSPKIVRTSNGKCCAWCDRLAGTYDYQSVKTTGNDVFRRHERCRCTVDYDPATGKRQNVHTKNWHYQEMPEVLEERKKINMPIAYRELNEDDIYKLESEAETWFQKLEKAEQEAIAYFTEDGFALINKGLRTSEGKENSDTRALDSALSRFRLGHNAVLYRGVGRQELTVLEASAHLYEYKSLTFSRDVAEDFAKYGNGEVVKFKVKGNVRGAYIGLQSINPGEQEFLLGRGARIKTRRVDGVLEVEIIEN